MTSHLVIILLIFLFSTILWTSWRQRLCLCLVLVHDSCYISLTNICWAPIMYPVNYYCHWIYYKRWGGSKIFRPETSRILGASLRKTITDYGYEMPVAPLRESLLFRALTLKLISFMTHMLLHRNKPFFCKSNSWLSWAGFSCKLNWLRLTGISWVVFFFFGKLTHFTVQFNYVALSISDSILLGSDAGASGRWLIQTNGLP